MLPSGNDLRRHGQQAAVPRPYTASSVRGEAAFTLLEVMVALAIMASVILTVLGAVNYQLGIIGNERDTTAFTLLARAKMFELEQQVMTSEKSSGTLAPAHPELTWQAELLPTELPMLRKLVVRVRRDADKREVTLERYISK